jgi:hypothetical protein
MSWMASDVLLVEANVTCLAAGDDGVAMMEV